MNVFVLSTGRCGSLTFARACSHIANYSAAHESRVARLGDDRVAFPPDHIEVDTRLSWFLGRLDRAYGDSAFYVHLTRDPEKVAASWARRFHVLGGMATGYRDHILAAPTAPRPISRAEAAADYVRTVTENIELFLSDKSRTMRFRFEEAEEAFPDFWSRIGAEGDLQAAMAEWRVRHDTETVRTRPKQRFRDFAVRLRRALAPPG